MSERLVLCGGAMPAAGDSPLRLALDGRFQNITLKLEDISKRLVANVPDRLIDLIETAAFIYCADQATSRGGEAQAGMGSDWRRRFRFVIPVRHPDHWSHPKVLEPLCDEILELSYLILERHFQLIKHTVSCTRSYDISRLHTHCGCCSQCIDRRFGIIAAGAAELDPAEMYKIELLTGAREKPNDQTMAESYVRTALELRDIDERAFFDRFSGETSRVCSGFPEQKSDDVARRVLSLHQRHGQAVGDVLTNAVKDHSAELVSGSLAPASVLVMAVAPSRVPALARIGNGSDPFGGRRGRGRRTTSSAAISTDASLCRR